MTNEITLLLPTYNRAGLLNKCLESVENQSFKGKIHCVISNNNSSDDTDEIIKDWSKKKNGFKISYIKNETDLDPLENWKKTLGFIDTEYSKWLQDDDWLEINAIETMLDDIKSYDANGIIYNCNIYTNNSVDPLIRYYQHDTKEITRKDIIDQVLQLAPPFPVSPTSSIFKSEYINFAISFGEQNEICTKKLLGNDLIMNFFGVFNDLKTYYIDNQLVNFYGGNDSITIATDEKYGSHCYLRSLALMIDHDKTNLEKKHKEIIEHRIFASKFRGIFKPEFKNISDINGYASRPSLKETLKYLKRKIN